MSLLGRSDECALLDGLIGHIRRGESRSLVLRGEAGIGKTALLRYLVESASDLTVARAEGVESEMELAFASLHQLCAPMLDRLERLPAPQRRALEIVFGVSAGGAPDRFLVGLAVLSLFSEVADERPLLCVVDDAQWLDQASALTLAFVARRLLAEPVGIVFAAREPGEALQHLPQLEVHGVSDGDARALLGSAVPFRLDVQVRDRIVAETRGNPLALLELPRGLTMTQLAGGFGLPGGQRLSRHIQESFARRLDRLPRDARRLVLVAAAEPVGDPVLLWRAAERLGIVPAAADEAEADGLLAIGERVRFRHPLARSAVYRSAPARARRMVHLALAEATDRDLDPDRRAWHLAAAAPGPDEHVALELQRCAGRAQARGGLAAAAAFLKRAVALTQDPARRADRALAAAHASLQAGAFDAALALADTAEAGPIDESQRARAELLRAQLAFASSRGTEATPLLLAAARRLEPLDVSLARETYVDAFSAALFGARLNDSVGVPDVAEAARAAPRRLDDEPTTADLLLDALVALTDDYEIAVPLCRRALAKLSGESVAPKERLRWLWQGCVVALEMWDDENAYFLSRHNVEIARETGTLSELALALSARTPVLVFCGELSAAGLAVAESDSVQEATGISSAPYGALILDAWRGRQRETRELIEMTMREAGARGEGIGVAISDYARAVLCNGLGQYEEALVAAYSASEHREVVAENWGLSELIEPATRTGRTDLATDALDRLAGKARATEANWARGIEARSRALLDEGGRADRRYREALEHLGRTKLRAEVARTHLVYGEWLRRENRRVHARAQLRAAHDQFTSMGMDAFAERARKELLATGERMRKRTAETRDELTAQERQIARLARDGLSNPEIGARLFLSPRTVEWHLRNVFTKLEIRSRRELFSALPSSESELAPTDALSLNRPVAGQRAQSATASSPSASRSPGPAA
jgi:DNA-binding CsgD family transcriptional regulator